MNQAGPDRFAAQSGFTLVESIVVLVLLSIAAVGIISLQGNIFYGQSGNKDIQVGVQLMQECAEQILAKRRQSGYASVDQNTCTTLGNYGGFGTPSVTVTSDASAVCPSGGTCKKVVISVSKTGASLTPVTLELVS